MSDTRRKVRADLADVALVSPQEFATAASWSMTSLKAAVRAGIAPQPVIRAPRCTRFRLADVREFLAQIAAKGPDEALSQIVRERATKAAHAARERRRSGTSGGAHA